MRNVTMVVPVLMANCQVSLKSKIGPVTIQTSTTPTASTNTLGRPQKCAAAFANREYQVVLGMRTFFRAHEREVRLRWIEDGRSPREPWAHRGEPPARMSFPIEDRSAGAGRDIAHQSQLISVGIGEFRQPELRCRSPIHDVGISHETDPFGFERGKHRKDLRNLKIDRGASLRLGTGGHHADKKAHVSAPEERHLRRRGEQERKAEDVPIESDASFEIVYRDQELPDFRIREVHIWLRQMESIRVKVRSSAIPVDPARFPSLA